MRGNGPGNELDALLGTPSTVDDPVDPSLLRSCFPDAMTETPPVEGDDWLGPERIAALIDQAAGETPPPLTDDARYAIWTLLDLIRKPTFLTRIAEPDRPDWARRIEWLIERSNFTTGPLFRYRAEQYGYKTLFEVPGGPGGTRSVTWLATAARVESLARGLLSLSPDGEPGPVAILSDNSLRMALADLACLTSGIVDVMIPANATERDVGFMLKQARVRTVLVSDATQLRKVRPHRDALPDLKHLVSLSPLPAGETAADVIAFDELMDRATRVDGATVLERSEAVRVDDLATIMYTSGTTGVPKGIRFSHRNLVFKRFARGLALPEIGDQDVFVCFLPLYHTFGRFLEMMGCVYWGATYCFVENPSIEALVAAMRLHRPTVFISVPKKWIQLYDSVRRLADPLEAPEDDVRQATRQVVGDRLRWGLSAAGHLDAEIFRFFQSQGVELMSGFGMTEATGGITMTPPGAYREDSLGVALPGIEIKLAEDGELLARGPYVMLGYVEAPEDERGFDDEGWFHTGDLMQADNRGHIRLVDRKKEIYKNVKGETIAPQRVENLFRDFASVRRVFLVGDHKEYNTLLIHPNEEDEGVDFDRMSPQALREHFRSLVVSVNKFLAPYERVVDFALIDRDFDLARGELTPKGTLRRKEIAAHFADTIQRLYRRTQLIVGDVPVAFPNWLFQVMGLTAQDVVVDGDRLVLPSRRSELVIQRLDDRRVRVGDCLYRREGTSINLGSLLTVPKLWLGNGQLVDFVALPMASRSRASRRRHGLTWDGWAAPQDPTTIPPPPEGDRPGLLHLDRAARRLASLRAADALAAIDEMGLLVSEEQESLAEATRTLLRRSVGLGSVDLARAAFRALAPAEKAVRFRESLDRFLDRHPDLLDEPTISALVETGLSDDKLDAVIDAAEAACLTPGSEEDRVRGPALLALIAAYGGDHPIAYRRLRPSLTRIRLFASEASIRDQATDAYRTMRGTFRAWLGPPMRVAVDVESGTEYGWSDVVSFPADAPAQDRRRLLQTLEGTPLLCEAVFLFTRGVLLRLSDLPPGGLTVRRLGSGDGKAVYRLTAQSRHQGSFDLAVNLNRSLPDREVDEEIQLLLLCNDLRAPHRLVEEFGGHYPDTDLWSEEFITGETLDRALARLAEDDAEPDRLRTLWPYLAWSALSTYVDFWQRSGRRWEISATHMRNVIVPTQDYQSGARIVSLMLRKPHRSLAEMLQAFKRDFIEAAEAQYPVLAGLAGWDVLFAAVLEIVGESEGLDRLDEAVREDGSADMADAFAPFRQSVEARGFLTLRLFFAAKRYRAWAALNGTATREARARTLQQLYETYGLARLAGRYPEVRARFFRETVFRGAEPALADALEELIGKLRRGELRREDVIDGVADVRSRLEVDEDADYFLARVSFPYLRPEDPAGYVSVIAGGRPQSEMVVALEDQEGGLFRVRHALNPKEVERLHRLFVASRVDVQFRPEHQYLVALSDRSQIIGGIYYAVAEDGESAHLEKIVVSDALRGKGVAQGLMNEFFNRLRAQGVRLATTGFFRPEYFYAWGFRVQTRFAGLVKSLEAPVDGPEVPRPSRRPEPEN